jgi:hypothetical protein|tara:strand:+ start:160 stop:342 length:183 start_codon:yes stop_codon:yes gene_type:complete
MKFEFDSKDPDIFYLPVYRDLAARYQRIVEENLMKWEGYEKDVVEAVKKECLINGNFTKK